MHTNRFRSAALTILLPASGLLALLGPMGACHSTPAPQPAPADVRFLHERILQVVDDPSGATLIGFELSALSYRIDPQLSPDAAAMIAFARRARDAGTPVYATCWDREHLPKTPENGAQPGLPNVLLRLADDPDPRAKR